MAYRLADYGRMHSDPVRMQPYARALRRALDARPGAVVLDLGAGSGIMALLACRFGASRVYAIEPNPTIAVAERLAHENGFAGRIRCVQASSKDVELPERAHILVSDLRGVLPLHGDRLGILADARNRFLAEDGIQIPLRDELIAAPVDVSETYDAIVAPWRTNPWQFDLSHGATVATQGFVSTSLDEDSPIARPATWAMLDLGAEPVRCVGTSLSWTIDGDHVAHGIGLWFATELYEGIGFSTAPSAARHVYGQGFLPWPEAVPISDGSEVRLELDATLVDAGWHWRWRTHIVPSGLGESKHFTQATLFGIPLGLGGVRSFSDRHVPKLSASAHVDQLALTLLTDGRSLGEVADAIAERWPGAFASPNAALTRVSRLARRYHAPDIAVEPPGLPVR